MRHPLLGLAAGLALLLSLVALASRGEVDTGAAERGVPPLLSGLAYAGLLAVALASVPLLVYFAVREFPESRRQGSRAWLAPFVLAGMAGAGLVISAYAGEDVAAALGRFRLRQPADAASAPPTLAWLPLALASGLGVAGFFALHRSPRRAGATRHETAALEAVLDAALDDLRDEPDPRRAIVAAYARLERALGVSGVPRGAGEAPFEYVARALRERTLSEEPVLELAALFEQAKFSLHELGEPAKQRAIAALETARGELR